MKRAGLATFFLGLAAAALPPAEGTQAASEEKLQEAASKFAGAMRVTTLAKSAEGREVRLVTIGRGEKVDARPALLIVGGVGGTSQAGAEIALDLAIKLAEEAAGEGFAGRTIYVIPRLDPDGLERRFQDLKRADSASTRPWDEDRDGATDEDGPDDLDGDKMILAMRIADAAGEWVEDEKDPGFMRKVDLARGERGAWRILTEGKDDDGDGAWNEDAVGGVDLDSNFTWGYKFHGARSGSYPMSEAESRALAEFVFAHPNITAAFVLGNGDNLVRQVDPSPPPNPLPEVGGALTALDPGDVLPVARFAQAWRKTTKRDRVDPAPLKNGGVAEWLYFHAGILTLSNPGWSVPWKAGDGKDLAAEGRESREARWTHRWLKANRAAEWVEWHDVTHPDFPGRKVQVGGWKPFAEELPDAKELAEAKKDALEFARGLVASFPRLEIRDVVVTKLDDNLWKVTATVANPGQLPTALRHGRRTRRARDVRVDAGGEAVAIRSGDARSMIPGLAAGAAKEFTWIVQGAAGAKLRVTADTDKAGTATAEVELK